MYRMPPTASCPEPGRLPAEYPPSAAHGPHVLPAGLYKPPTQGHHHLLLPQGNTVSLFQFIFQYAQLDLKINIFNISTVIRQRNIYCVVFWSSISNFILVLCREQHN